MSDIPLMHAFILAAILFVIGFVGVMTRRNTLYMLMSLEVMLNSVGIGFIAAGSAWQEADGQVMFILILTLAAAEVAVGLALLIRLQQQRQSLDIDELSQMRG